jgi:D-ornithine 4,5-aminomutase subunit alpha
MAERGWLGRGAGRLLVELARRRGVSVRDAGLALLAGKHWDELGG